MVHTSCFGVPCSAPYKRGQRSAGELKPTFRSVLGTPRADYFVDGAPGVSIRNALESTARCEYYRVFGPNPSPDGKVQTAISTSSDGKVFWSMDSDYH